MFHSDSNVEFPGNPYLGAQKIAVDVFQIGAREHYAVPEMLQDVGMLRYLHTDVYSGPGSILYPLRWLPFIPSRLRLLRSLNGRSSSLPSKCIKSNNLLGIFFELLLKANIDVYRETYLRHHYQRMLAQSALMKMRLKPEVVIGFRGSDFLFESLRQSSCCILDQIDGGLFEVDLVREEQERFPDWRPKKPKGVASKSWLDLERPRLGREWAAADAIVCNSVWSKKCLIESGVQSDKCHVIPLAFKPQIKKLNHDIPKKNYRRGSLTVGFLGTVTLRKGIHYLLEAARHANRFVDVQVLVAGPIGIPIERLYDYKDIAVYLGKIPRADVPSFFRKLDILALPSISEGFGIVQLEAMANGIPVLATDRVGDVVRDGLDGVLVPAGDPHAISQAFIRLAEDPTLRAKMSESALSRIEDFSPGCIGHQWRKTILSIYSDWSQSKG